MSIHKGYITTFKRNGVGDLVLYHEHSTRSLIKLHQTQNFAIQRFLRRPVNIENVNRSIRNYNSPLYLVEYDVITVSETPVLDFLSN